MGRVRTARLRTKLALRRVSRAPPTRLQTSWVRCRAPRVATTRSPLAAQINAHALTDGSVQTRILTTHRTRTPNTTDSSTRWVRPAFRVPSSTALPGSTRTVCWRVQTARRFRTAPTLRASGADVTAGQDTATRATRAAQSVKLAFSRTGTAWWRATCARTTRRQTRQRALRASARRATGATLPTRRCATRTQWNRAWRASLATSRVCWATRCATHARPTPFLARPGLCRATRALARSSHHTQALPNVRVRLDTSCSTTRRYARHARVGTSRRALRMRRARRVR